MSYQHLLVAVDGSPTADHAVNEATGLAKATGGRIRLLNVMDPLAHISGFERPEVYSQEVLPRLRQAGEACCAAPKSAWRKAVCRWTRC